MGRAADGDRGDAAGSALSAIARGCEGAELRRQCDGGFLGTRLAGPEIPEGALLECGGEIRGGNTRTARAAGTDPAGRAQRTVGEGIRRLYAAARIRGGGNESRRAQDPATAAWSGGAGAIDRLRECRRADAGARIATPTGIRRTDRTGDGARRSVATGRHGESSGGFSGWSLRSGAGIRRGATVQVDCGTRRSAPRWCNGRLVAASMGIRRRGAGVGFCGGFASIASVPSGPDGGIEECRTERNSRNRGEGVCCGESPWRRRH